MGGGLYTQVNLGLGLLTMLLHLLLWNKQQINFFLSTYILVLIPMSFVNGVLTSFPVLIYNPAENLGIRLGTIPIEDFIYAYILIGLVFIFYFKQLGNIAKKANSYHLWDPKNLRSIF